MHVIYDAVSVEIRDRRWSAELRINRPDGTTTVFRFCAEGDHSGLWIGDPAEDDKEHGQ